MKKIIVFILWGFSLIVLGYAIYRSTDVRETQTLQPGREITYGEPQHGLILGLCILSGLLIMSSIPLLLDRKGGDVLPEDRDALSRRKL